MMYADDDARGFYSNTFSDSDNNLNHLFRRYVPSLEVFRCPATRNYVRTEVWQSHPITGESELTDLADIATGTTNPGSSYEIFGFMNYNGHFVTEFSVAGRQWAMPGVKKSITSVQSHAHQNEAFGLKGVVAGPSRVWLILDADLTNNFPNRWDNHGADGANVSKCDGSVAWVRRTEYSWSYEMSQDEGRESRM